ncbi:coiled-coil domain-containing protein 127-like [Megalops cyprinoides]|uniref:coiled-coil domain-containing protein 127-like n=1 Tax=Megalops cyprinoides TaxID=118141 RepID=UPI0018648DC9|nr:coiled-coil domain-containing protein 127-like [Megalops cyprinoides]XP_036371752.1 coiled-coil domain-containing protein 127-like [Megalops cyprinoides]XP_036371753.1 coiled-coil domain-containing protein 127-like [Megalops cyprinoides]
MNNLNDPPIWNIRPDQGGGGDGNKWNYALLVPMLGLAAFRWIWSRESQREIQEAKSRYEKDMKAISKDLEMKYRQTLTESQRMVAHLELELEKERHRVEGYRKALASQSQQLLEQRQGLQREREALEKEREQLLRSGSAGALLQGALERESAWQQRATAVLREFEENLVERQNLFCSVLIPRERRLELERNLLIKSVKEPVATELNMEADLKDIFKNDRHCADLLNTDKRRNGSLMWLYLRYWQLKVAQQKNERAKASLLKPQSDFK